MMGLVEPPMAATLELQRLRAFDKVRGLWVGGLRGW